MTYCGGTVSYYYYTLFLVKNQPFVVTEPYYYFGTRFPDERMASIGQTSTQR